MARRVSSWAMAPLLLLLGCSSDDGAGKGDGPGSEVEPFQAGFALRDLSPTAAELETGTVYMGAYGLLTQRGAAVSVHDSVYARTLVLGHDGTRVSMTILDMPGLSNRVIREIVARASDATGMSPEAVHVGATHSHSAPDMQGLWGSVPDEYRTRLIELTAESIVEAHDSLADAELEVSSGTAPNRNRRGWDETDPELTVLEAKKPDGERIATLVQFAAHPVKLGVINHEISRDFPGYTVDHLEATLGGPVLYFNGIIGDCSPDGGESQPGCDLFACEFQEAESYGLIVAEAALDAMEAGSTALTPGLVTGHQSWDQTVTNAAFIGLNDAGFLDYDTLPLADGGMGLRTQGAYFRLGAELQGVAFPGEALTRTGLVIKERMKTSHKLFLGLTTDTLGYFVPADEWNTGRNGDYEETVSVGLGAAEQAIEVIGGLVDADNDSF